MAQYADRLTLPWRLMAFIANGAGILFFAGLFVGGGWVIWHREWEALLLGIGVALGGAFAWKLVALPSFASTIAVAALTEKARPLVQVMAIIPIGIYQNAVTLVFVWVVYSVIVIHGVQWSQWGLVLWGFFAASAPLAGMLTDEPGTTVGSLLACALAQVAYWALVIGHGILGVKAPVVLGALLVIAGSATTLVAVASMKERAQFPPGIPPCT